MSTIRKRLFSGAKALACTVAATTAVALTAASAQAATTYTPGGGPDVNFVGSSVSFTDDDASQTLTCTQFDLGGAVTDPGTSRAYGEAAGSMSTLTSDGCTNPIAGNTTVTPNGTWSVVITGDATGTVWPASLADVNATVTAAGCTFTAGGGEVTGTFDTSTQKFTPDASTLTIVDDPSGAICPLIGVAQGDAISVAGSWTNAGSSPLTLANP